MSVSTWLELVVLKNRIFLEPRGDCVGPGTNMGTLENSWEYIGTKGFIAVKHGKKAGLTATALSAVAEVTDERRSNKSESIFLQGYQMVRNYTISILII
jgi:hypothetical protein